MSRRWPGHKVRRKSRPTPARRQALGELAERRVAEACEAEELERLTRRVKGARP